MDAENQATNPNTGGESPVAHEGEWSVTKSISAEWLAYIALALLALILRLTMLDAVPMTDMEAQQALHALHTVNAAIPGDFVTASSPLTYLTQILTFSFAGANEFNARVGAALAGLALAMTPLLFRDSLGKTRTFVWSVLLCFLTVPLAASRTADGASFMLLFTVLAVWMIRRYWYSQRLKEAYWGISFVMCMLLLSSPSGLPLLIILLAAGWLAVWRTALSAPQRLELPGDDILQLTVQRLHGFPYGRTIIAPLLMVIVVATLFMVNPAGLSTVAQLVEVAISGFSTASSSAGSRLGFGALVHHEPLLIVFACGGAWLLWKHGDVTYVDRFAAAWAALGCIGLLLHPGARAADALWVIVPLTMLASYGITQLMVNRRVVILWSNAEDYSHEERALYTTRYWWVKWAISAGVLLCLFVLSVQFMQVARLMAAVPAGTALAEAVSLGGDASQVRLAQGFGLLLVTSVICAIVFLLVANFWGLGTSLQGTGIGFFWLLLLSGMGGAWQASVSMAHYPDGLWRESAITEDAYLLRETLFELAARESLGFPDIRLTIVADEDSVVSSHGLVAWLARDFPNTRFLNVAAAAAGDPIVLMAENDSMTHSLAGDYVGQRFVLRRRASLADIDPWDWPAWWSQGRLATDLIHVDAVILWLRQDVYDGVAT